MLPEKRTTLPLKGYLFFYASVLARIHGKLTNPKTFSYNIIS